MGKSGVVVSCPQVCGVGWWLWHLSMGNERPGMNETISFSAPCSKDAEVGTALPVYAKTLPVFFHPWEQAQLRSNNMVSGRLKVFLPLNICKSPVVLGTTAVWIFILSDCWVCESLVCSLTGVLGWRCTRGVAAAHRWGLKWLLLWFGNNQTWCDLENV